jgi:GDP-4-dehydro-6-deoxy-D-mannose reductase
MKKILITGASGFVGGHFIRYLASRPDDFEIHAISRKQPAWDFFPESASLNTAFTFHQADLMDGQRIGSLIEKIQPDIILHLAAQSSVAESWKTPVSSFLNNTTIFLNVIDTVRLHDNATRILSIGSSEQYGIVSENDLPLRENSAQHPSNPYAVARVAQEQLAMVYAEGFGLDICCTRSFNHCGPGQTDRFVASAIAKQFAGISLGLQDPVIEIGDGTIVRDFLDVRDVVAAYAMIMEKGVRGQVYNVCSGRGYTIYELVTLLAEGMKIPVQIIQNPTKRRPQDNPHIVGSPEKIRRELGWHPHISLADSMKEMSAWWETRLLREHSENKPSD